MCTCLELCRFLNCLAAKVMDLVEEILDISRALSTKKYKEAHDGYRRPCSPSMPSVSCLQYPLNGSHFERFTCMCQDS